MVGAGPAGLMAAISGAESGARVLLYEHLAEAGTKLNATGGGRCNFTHLEPVDVLARHFQGAHRFVIPALSALPPDKLMEFFASLGIRSRADDHACVFPSDGSARDVSAALLQKAHHAGVELYCNVTGLRLVISGSAVQGLESSTGLISSPCAVLATGGKSCPHLGANGSGYVMAGAVGHTMVPPRPALAPLILRETWPAECAGSSLEDVEIKTDLPSPVNRTCRGDVLFTHQGLSGPAALNLSGDVAALLAGMPAVPLRLQLVPGMVPGQWEERLRAWRNTHGRKLLYNVLQEILPQKLAAIVCREAGVEPHVRAAHVTRELMEHLAGFIAGAPLTAIGTGGFDQAMATRGGIALEEVDRKTLQSRKIRGLYFAGEILDVDGPCGGYNLQWAFASGRLAGLSAALAAKRK